MKAGHRSGKERDGFSKETDVPCFKKNGQSSSKGKGRETDKIFMQKEKP